MRTTRRRRLLGALLVTGVLASGTAHAACTEGIAALNQFQRDKAAGVPWSEAKRTMSRAMDAAVLSSTDGTRLWAMLDEVGAAMFQGKVLEVGHAREALSKWDCDYGVRSFNRMYQRAY